MSIRYKRGNPTPTIIARYRLSIVKGLHIPFDIGSWKCRDSVRTIQAETKWKSLL